MKKRLCFNHQTILFFLLVFSAQLTYAQCDLTDFDIEVNGGACPNDGVISLQYTGNLDCIGVQAILTIVGNPTPIIKNIPDNGSVEFDNLLSSPDQGYTLKLILGSEERDFPLMTIPTTYIPMILNSETSSPSCPGGTDGGIIVNIASGGTGPNFIYELLDTSGSLIESSGEITDRTYIFSVGLEEGTYGYRVTDLGCNLNQRDQAIVLPNSTASSLYRNANFARSNRDCNLYDVLFRLSVFSAEGRAKIQEAGNATIAINGGAPVNLTLTNINGNNVVFEYPPGLPGGVDFNLSFNDGCSTFSGGNTTLPIDNNLMNIDVQVGFDSTTCMSTHLLNVLATAFQNNPNPQPSDTYAMFLERNEIIVEQETSPGVWEDVTARLGGGSNNPLVTVGNPFILPGRGRYRVSGKDDCHTTDPIVFDTKEETNPLNDIIITVAKSVLEGTVGLEILNTPGLPDVSAISETTYSIEPVPFQSSITINPTQPYTLAGSYTIQFPLVYTTTTNNSIIGDLPPGEYKIIASDDCSRANNSSVEKRFTIPNSRRARYNPMLRVIPGCRNSNTIEYEMNTINVARTIRRPMNNIIVELWTDDGTGQLGNLLLTDENTSSLLNGSFSGLTPGKYIIRFSSVNFESTERDLLYSAVTASNEDREYITDVLTIEEPEPIDVNTAGTFCDFNNSSSGVILAQIPDSGLTNLVYPITFELFNATPNGMVIGNAISQITIPNGPERSHIFEGLSDGDYIVRTTTGCGGSEVAAALSFSPISPVIVPDQNMVCPGTEVTLTIDDVSPFIFDITWKDGQGNILNTDKSDTSIIVPVQQTTTYTVEYVAKARLCSGTTPSTATITITVPITSLEVTEDTVCEGDDATVTIADTEIGITYELLLGGNPLTPEVNGEGTGADLVLTIPSDQLVTGTTTYTIGISGNGCASAMLDETVDLIVNPLPVVTFDAPTDICVDANALDLNTLANPVGGTFSGPGVTGNSFDPAIAGTGAHDLTYEFTDANGCTNSITVAITVNDLPVVTFDNPSDICVDANALDLTSLANPVGGTFSGPGVTGNSFDPTIAGTGVHNLTYEFTDVNGCINSATAIITVNDLPVVSFNDPADICVDANAVDLTTLASPVGGTFSGPGVTGNNFDPAVAGTGAHILTYEFTDTNGCTNSTTATITVNALPVVTFTGPSDICVDANALDLTTLASPIGGTFSGPGVTGNSFDPATAGTGAHILTYEFTDTNGCTNSDTAQITVNALPVVTFTDPTDICVDADVLDLTSFASPVGGTFSGPGVTGNSFDPATAGTGAHDLTYEFTDTSGCINSATATITVNDLPILSVTDAATCSIDLLSYSLNVSVSSGTVTSTSGSVINTSGNIWSITDVPAATNITITVTDANSCDSTLEVMAPDCNCPIVNAPIGGSDQSYCTGTTIPTLTANVELGETVDWYDSPSGGTPLLSGNTSYTPTVAGTYYAEARNTNNNCTSTTRTPIQLIENALPLLTFDAPAGICVDAGALDLTILANPTGGTFSGPGVTGNSFDPATVGVGTHTITYEFTDTNGCTNTATAIITVNALPIVTFTDPANICVDADVLDLTTLANPIGGVFSGTGVTGNSFDPATAGTGTHTLTYEFTNANGCTSSDTAQINVTALLAQTGTETISCALDGQSYVLTVLLNGAPPFSATGNGAPGTFVGNTWTSDPIPAGTDYSIDFTDINNCNTVTVADVAPVCCVFEVTCPTFPATTVQCYEELPSATTLTETEFEALGNADGSIGDIPCGVIEITAVNGPDTGNCNVTVVRTYTITEYGDTNGNGIRDLGEDTVLNTEECTQNITVQDTTNPVFVGTLPADITVECDAVPAPETFTATDNCGTATVAFTETRTDGSCPSDYSLERTWTATDECGLTTVHIQTITVQDTTSPVFVGTLPADITVECDAQIPVAETLSATDNCGTATVAFTETRIDGSCPSDYSLERTWTATNECGIETIHVQTINVGDTTAPVFVEALPQDGFAECDTIPEVAILTATDNCGAVTVDFTETEVPGNCSSQYSLVRTWTATDECGNETSHTQTLQLTCPLTVYNAVSANNNGQNDIFLLEGIDCFPNNQVEIFNRWGIKVFEANGYDNLNKVFKGYSDGRLTIARGEKLPTGTYFYILQYQFTGSGQSRTIQQSGYLYLTSDK
ncbi:gliding motility-associated C-terminal domain-containing protein [Spongiimicrobium sp. 3-5]|uniref:T9SS type B sorting domain-containing protein n=1 Tax=Spongiimicrobium sp. 3-5 TaxID=3332596 RepID=UPI00397ED65C